MSPDALAAAYTRLRRMKTGPGQEWDDDLRENCALVLAPLDDEIGLAAVLHAVKNEEWRPAPARLRQIAAEVASPIPDHEQAYAEIIYKAQIIGTHGTPDPANPNVSYTGPPPMSHPAISRIVAYLGGWEMVCNGEAQMQEGLVKQVRGAHESVARQWRQEVSAQLELPRSKWNPLYFRRYQPFELPDGFVPGVTGLIEAARKALPSVEVSALPEDVRKHVRRAIASLPPAPKVSAVKIEEEDKPAPPSLTAEQRRGFEYDVMMRSDASKQRCENPEYVRRRIAELTRKRNP